MAMTRNSSENGDLSNAVYVEIGYHDNDVQADKITRDTQCRDLARSGSAVIDRLDFHLPSPAKTESFGRRLGQLLFPGAVVALICPLGAGKTQLVRAIAEGLDIADSRFVSSPTF